MTERKLLEKFNEKQKWAGLESLANFFEFLSQRPNLIQQNPELTQKMLSEANEKISGYLDAYLNSEFVDFNGGSYQEFEKFGQKSWNILQRLFIPNKKTHLESFSGNFRDICEKVSKSNISVYTDYHVKYRNIPLQSVIKLKQVRNNSKSSSLLKYNL